MKKLVLSQEVMDLESSNTRLNFEEHYKQAREDDACLTEIMDYFQNELVEATYNCLGTVSLTIPAVSENEHSKEVPMIRIDKATDVLIKAMLNLYYLMQVQAEINEIEPGKKNKR